jgi:NAD(P)H dehydrogenase (quinone)
MILITGAGGKSGQAIIHALAQQGMPVRAFVRNQSQAERVQAAGAVESFTGDLADGAALYAAAAGIRALYHICPNMHPQEADIGARVIAAAQAQGVARFVYHSVLHPQAGAMPHHWQKLRVEEQLFTAGLEYTILQPTAYMQNLLANWHAITQQGRYANPYPVNAVLALVDLADVASVAARVLTESGHQGATYELVGTRPLAQSEVAGVLSEVLGRPVQAEEIPLDEWAAMARAQGLSGYRLETLLAMFRYYAHHGLIGNPNVLCWLLRRAPTTLAEFIGRYR